jgi:glycosyltransferase involved in cell wall biosynthesis
MLRTVRDQGSPVSGAGKPSISVIVPTHDRPLALSRCLEALSAQTVRNDLEVIVVDDGSRAVDDVAAVAAQYLARLVRREGGGPAGARNAGARAAQGSFLCFTDDDCAPRPDWVERLVEALQGGADAAAGTTTLTRTGALADAFELITEAPARVQPADGSDLSFAPSNNIACTKAAFEATPFDESYPRAAGEDREWCARLAANGFVLRSAHAAHVLHDQELTLRAFLGHQVRYGDGAFRFRRNQQGRPLEPPAFYVALLRRAFGKGFATGLLVCAAQAATAAGFVKTWALARSPRLQ